MTAAGPGVQAGRQAGSPPIAFRAAQRPKGWTLHWPAGGAFPNPNQILEFFPVVCFDETSRLTGDVRPPIKAAPGRVERYDTSGARNLFSDLRRTDGDHAKYLSLIITATPNIKLLPRPAVYDYQPDFPVE